MITSSTANPRLEKDRARLTGSGDTSETDRVIDRCSSQVAVISAELLEVTQALLEEIERDRKLMGGIQRRDAKMKAQQKQLKELEQLASDQKEIISTRENEISARDTEIQHLREDLESVIAELEAYRALLNPKGLARFLPVRLRGKNVPTSLLAIKQQYWKVRNQFQKKETR